MTIYDDPNREAVGLDPAWVEGTGGVPGTDEPTLPESAPEGEAFDPGDHTVAEVEDYIAAHPDEEADVLAAEQAGKNRTTLVGGLED